ncbi:hypothetical protein [Roseiflexus sp.]|uniref:hypothetical protein n=1 Tax=Roseiflexus sp. TaxID=2562120 RepID=UPI00398AC4DA
MGAVAGRRTVMQVASEMFIGSTCWSDAVGLAAALATIRELRRRDIPVCIGAFGSAFQELFNALAKEHGVSMRATGLPQLTGIGYTDLDAVLRRPLKDYYIQELTRRGIFASLSVNPCAAHGDMELDEIERALGEIFPLLRAVLQAGDWDSRLMSRSVDAFRR